MILKFLLNIDLKVFFFISSLKFFFISDVKVPFKLRCSSFFQISRRVCPKFLVGNLPREVENQIPKSQIGGIHLGNRTCRWLALCLEWLHQSWDLPVWNPSCIFLELVRYFSSCPKYFKAETIGKIIYYNYSGRVIECLFLVASLSTLVCSWLWRCSCRSGGLNFNFPILNLHIEHWNAIERRKGKESK